MNFIYKILCKFDYHVKTHLVEVTISFGESGKVEKIQCDICKKIYIKQNSLFNLNPQVLVIVLIVFIILLLLF